MKIRIEITSDDGAVYSGEAVLHSSKNKASQKKSVDVEHVKAMKCPDALKLLWESGQFVSPLSLSDIKTALKANGGYHFPDNTLSMALTNTPFLTRKGTKRSYTWVQKYPS
ncbi:MAG TPA: hypothetical protein VJT54_05820 [Verrucomicrobiae bacterium]|nr:hypothetical protein [Verrucomicrobiae bacterium]